MSKLNTAIFFQCTRQDLGSISGEDCAAAMPGLGLVLGWFGRRWLSCGSIIHVVVELDSIWLDKLGGGCQRKHPLWNVTNAKLNGELSAEECTILSKQIVVSSQPFWPQVFQNAVDLVET